MYEDNVYCSVYRYYFKGMWRNLDSASGFGPEGCGFKSRHAHYFNFFLNLKYTYLNDRRKYICSVSINDDNMEGKKEEFHARKMEMWKKREELLNTMSEQELRAFIKGYMMGQRSIFKQLDSTNGCGCEGGCGCGNGMKGPCGCNSENCNCKGKECNCENE